MKITTSILKILSLTLLLAMAANVHAVITIDSVITTPSNCANNGSASIFAVSGGSMIYAIISGPDIRPAQSGHTFGGLPSGIYQVMVTDYSNDTALATVIIGGSYTAPDFNPLHTDPRCPGGSTGIITGNPLPSGLPPYTWVLINLATNDTASQRSDTFENLPAGTYSLRMTDSCQSFATQQVTLSDPDVSFSIYSILNYLTDCDTTLLRVTLNGDYLRPLTLSIQSPLGLYVDSVPGWLSTNSLVQKMAGISYNDSLIVTVTNACGYSVTKTDYIPSMQDMYIVYEPVVDSPCELRENASLQLNYYNDAHSSSQTFIHTPVTMTVTDDSSGALVDSFTIIDSAGYVSSINVPALAGNHNYTITIRDTCGNQYQDIFAWPSAGAPTLSVGQLPNSCLDSTASFIIQMANFPSAPTLTIISGPAIVASSKPGYAYRDTISYPIGYYLDPLIYGNSNNFGIALTDLGPGVYQISATDSCGDALTSSFTVTPQEVSDYRYQFSYIRGCAGANKVIYGVGGGNLGVSQTIASVFYNGAQISRNFYFGVPANTYATDTLMNLGYGTYVLTLDYSFSGYMALDTGQHCITLYDTIYIPLYQPPRIAYATQTRCTGAVNVGLLPDSTSGVPPFAYEIISGPQTTALQSSNFFTLTQPGTYVVRIRDTCGSAGTFTFTVDTLSFAQVVQVGSSCPGGSAVLICQHSPYATYVWQLPGGGTYTGDTLHLDPVQPADYGLYHITKFVSVNHCSDTFYTTYTLIMGGMSSMYDTICSGQNVAFGGAAHTQTGIYYDTIPTLACDSIVILTLTVRAMPADSEWETICTGQSVTVGTHTYSTTGIYRDTFSTLGCDSVHILYLQAGGVHSDSVSRTICAGQSVTVGTHSYTSSGIYRDTFATVGCDSVVITRVAVQTPAARGISLSGLCSLIYHGNTYSADTTVLDTLAGSMGCDSLYLTVQIHLQPPADTAADIAVCLYYGQVYPAGGRTWTASGSYSDTLRTASGGCDSAIIHTAVTVVSPQLVGHRTDSCFSATIGGITYSADTIVRDTIYSVCGLDSIIAIDTLRFFKPSVMILSAGQLPIAAGGSTQLTISPPGIYQDIVWSPDYDISDIYAASPRVSPAVSTTYYVTAEDSNHCTVSAQIPITVIAPGAVPPVFLMPTAFSPNGDGLNDGYGPILFGSAEVLFFHIYDRWGQLIFDNEMTGTNTWDGTYKNVNQPVGVYVYYISVKISTEDVIKQSGNLTLMR